jgi:hypothetical protein
MDKKHFYSEMKKIAETFGTKTYGDVRVELIWAEVQMLSNEWMSKVANYFIGYHRQAPLLTEFKEEIAKENERQWKLRKEQTIDFQSSDVDKYFCVDCMNTGLVFGADNYMFKCHCAHGSKRVENYPRLVRTNLRAIP